MISLRVAALLALLAAGTMNASAAGCEPGRVRLQMLGTRGPELLDGRASTGYLLWLDGRARVVIDAGPGTVQRFEESGADYRDVELLLFTHFHVDHSADFAAYVKGGFFTDRSAALHVIGPSGTEFVSSAGEFVDRMVGPKGSVYPYLGNFVDPDATSAYKIVVRTLDWSLDDLSVRPVYGGDGYTVKAVPVHHGPFPAFGYRVEMAGCVISFTGDMSGRLRQMPGLAKGSDILVAHNAVPEDAVGVPARLHMTPSYIGEMAAEAGVRQLLLTHLMRRTIDRREETLRLIRAHYHGPVAFPDDLDVFRPESPGT